MKFNITPGDWSADITDRDCVVNSGHSGGLCDLMFGVSMKPDEEQINNAKAMAAVPQMLALLEKSRLMLLGVDLLKSTGNKNCLALSEEITSFLSQFEAK